jgi:predicted homoserine dehydrogenase-like protein
VVAEHPFERPEVLRYLKLGDGPYYTLLRPFHLCHLEMIKTLRRVVAGKAPLMNNSTRPRVGVATVAKRRLEAGEVLGRAAGGYAVRGEAVMMAEAPEAVPLGLLDGARLTRVVEKGETLTWADVETREGEALKAALALRERLAGTVSRA